MSLHQLSKETVHLLSSSQVITSVYAVVKELVENALDAKATSIEVKLENFGLNVIEVRDNGSGIKKEGTVNMARPHFTSKLTTFNDLQSLEYYGFRGEALASIAAVSNLSITTRTQSDAISTTYTLDHSGNVTSTKHSHLGQGTTVTAANIFMNLPVRKQCFKSAKKCKEELGRVEDMLIGFGLAHCGLRLTLKHNKCIIWQKIQTSDFGSNVSLILGIVLFQQLVPMNYQSFSPMVKIRAFVPKPEADLSMVSRSTPDKIYLLVNQRCVTVKPLIQLLKQVFSDSFPSQSGRYPVAVVMITVPPTDIDVNLEPNKTLVLLQNMDFILATMESLLTKLYSRCKVGDAEAATSSSGSNLGKTETAVAHATQPDHQQKPATAISRAIQCYKETSHSRSEVPPTRSWDAATDRDSSDHTRLCAPAFQLQSARSLAQSTVPPDNVATLQYRGSQSELESDDHDMVTGSKGPPMAERSSSTCEDPVVGQSMDQKMRTSGDGDVSLSHKEMESFELLDVSDFENDNSSESLPPSPLQPVPHPSSSDSTESAATRNSGFQFNQMSLSQWSRGEALKDCGGQPIEPVRVLTSAGRSDIGSAGQCSTHIHSRTSTTKQPPSQSKLNYKGPPPIFDMIHSKPVKRKADTSSIPQGEEASAKKHKPLPSLLQKLIHGDSTKDVPCKELSVDLEMISERGSANDCSAMAGEDSSSVIGFVEPPGVWLVVVNGSIACFNTNPSSQVQPASDTLPQLSLPTTRKEVKQLLQDLLAKSRSTSSRGNFATDGGYLDINNFLHNLKKL